MFREKLSNLFGSGCKSIKACWYSVEKLVDTHIHPVGRPCVIWYMLYYYGCLKIIIHERLPEPRKDDIFSRWQVLKARCDN